MAGMSLNTVVFDLGGVLITWDPRAAFHDVLPRHEVEPFLDEIDFLTLNRGIDAGRPMHEVEAEVDERFPHRRGVLAAYHRNFPDSLTGEVPGTADIVRELSAAGVRLLALTNWSAQTFPHARELFPVLAEFEGIVVSGEESMVKPDPRLFQRLFERHQVVPSSAVFVDDSAANVAAAADLGLTALQFSDAGTLRSDLVRLGLPLVAGP
jgi:2-haloacid dehalogenase